MQIFSKLISIHVYHVNTYVQSDPRPSSPRGVYPANVGSKVSNYHLRLLQIIWFYISNLRPLAEILSF